MSTKLHTKLPRLATVALAFALVPAAACDLDVPDLDNPGIDELLENPTRVGVSSACTGLQISNRRNRAAANGYIAQLGILGREAYNFDQADPRFIGELLEGNLQKGSPFGGNFWAGPYASIRLANIVESVLDRVPDYSAAEKAAVRGFATTIEAVDLLEVITTRDTIGAVVDTDKDVKSGALGPIVDKPAVLTEIARLLDEAAGYLAMGGERFPFALTRGYAGFDTPANFAKFNKAIRARVAAYQKDYAGVITALGGSFINDMATTVAQLETGVYHTYSIGAGDTQNGLINQNIFAHPSVKTDVQSMPNQDERFVRKVETAKAGSARGLTSDQKFTIYTNASSPVPIIRNEELLLLRAEARWFTNAKAMAMVDLNLVRTVSGGLGMLGMPADDAAFVTALLYERRYSLLFEGHRWIDVRRLDRIMDLPLDMPNIENPPTHGRNLRYPIPQAECDARPGEPACMVGSK
jgi:starch-binding outer membrane protein, SusD/RagB family